MPREVALPLKWERRSEKVGHSWMLELPLRLRLVVSTSDLYPGKWRGYLSLDGLVEIKHWAPMPDEEKTKRLCVADTLRMVDQLHQGLAGVMAGFDPIPFG